MKPPLLSNNFSRAFSKLLEKTGVSCYQMSQYSGLDQAYLSRLKSGQKCNPSPEALMRISLAFTHFSDKVNMYDIEILFNSAGRFFSIKH